MKSLTAHIGSISLALAASPGLAAKTEVSFKEPMAIDLGYLITVLAVTLILLFAAGIVLTLIKKKGLIKAVQGSKSKTSISIVSSTKISTRTTAIILDIDQQRLLILEHPSSVVVKEVHQPANPSDQL